MAYYSLWKWFSPWRKTKYTNYIYYYKEFVLKTEEQRKLEKIEKEKELKEMKLRLLATNSFVRNLGSSYMS